MTDISKADLGSILVVEDQTSLRKAVAMICRKLGRDVVVADDGQAAWEILDTDGANFDLVVSDWMMPRMDGYELLQTMRGSDIHHATPFLMLTAKQTEESLLEALSNGANDFVGKPFKTGELLIRAENLLRMREEFKRLIEASLRDGLTGLYNHRYFQDALAREMARSKRYDLDMSIILFDIDHFKKFNDDHGHQAGDAVLNKVGDLVNRTLRQSDVVCRYGGEEFSVILPSTGIEDATMMADRIRDMYEHLEFDYQGEALHITASFGVAAMTKDQLPEQLIKQADEALYEAKSSGRNCVRPKPTSS